MKLISICGLVNQSMKTILCNSNKFVKSHVSVVNLPFAGVNFFIQRIYIHVSHKNVVCEKTLSTIN